MYLDKMEELQNEVGIMKQKQNEKSLSYKKIKKDFQKLKSKTKKEGSVLNKFLKKFENDLAFARNWVLSFERDLANFSTVDGTLYDDQSDSNMNKL